MSDKDEIMKGLGIKSLDDILAETDSAFVEYDEEDDTEIALPDVIEQDEPSNDDGPLMRRMEMTNGKHSRDMKRVFDSAMEMADRLADMGMNIDPLKAPRMFEVMGQHLKIAADASNSERDAQLKLMKLMMDKEKLEIDRMRLNHELGEKGEAKGDIIMIEDRNKILAQLRTQK